MPIEILAKNPDLARLARLILSGWASNQDLSAAKPEEVRAIKSDPGEIHYQSCSYDVEKVPAGEAERSMRYVASDETTDRMGDVIKVSGWDLKAFKKNPQALWSHMHGMLPIGRVTSFEKGLHNGRPALLETIQYLSAELNEFAEAVWRLVEAGAIKAVSVGFVPIETEWPDTPEERELLGLGAYGILFKKQEQIELSNCTVPANPACLPAKEMRKQIEGALGDLVRAGQVDQGVATRLLGKIEEPVVFAVTERNTEAACYNATAGTTGNGSVFHSMELRSTDPATDPVLLAIAALTAEVRSCNTKLDRCIAINEDAAAKAQEQMAKDAQARASMDAKRIASAVVERVVKSIEQTSPGGLAK